MSRILQKLFPHELMFGAFIICTLLRLGIDAGWFDQQTLLYVVYLALNVFFIFFDLKQQSILSRRLRLFYYPVFLNVFFPSLRDVMPLIHPAKEDLLLQQ